jgi:ABC-type glycerol-3-phosphate transport system substrate-binding protein
MTLTLMTISLQPAFTEYMSGVIEGFESAHPDTRIDWVDLPIDGYLNKLQTMLLDDDPPDVVNLTHGLGMQIASMGVFADLRDHLDEATLDSYFPRVLRTAGVWQEEVYALPWYLTTHVMMYNRALMEEAGLDPDRPPTTHPELFTMSRQIRERLPSKFGFFEALTEEGHLREIFLANNISLTAESSDGTLRAAFNTPEAIEVLRTYADLFKDGILPRDSLTQTHARGIELYKAGTTVFFTSGPQFLRFIAQDAPDVYAVTDVAPQVIPPNKTLGVDVMNITVPKQPDGPGAAERRQRAAELAAFITNAENQLAFCKLVTILPSVRDAAEDPYFTESDGSLESRARVIGADQLDRAAVLIPSLPEAGRLTAALSRAMEQAALDVKSPEEALAEAEATWNSILANAR